MNQNLKEKLIEVQNDLPKQQQKLCKFIIEHIGAVSTMTIQELSERSEVGTSTILRFIDKIGYKKYPQFKNDVIQYNFDKRTNTWWHLKKSLEEMDETEVSLVKVSKGSIEDIESMLNELDQKEYEKSLKTLLHANRIYFLGMRTSKSLSLYFEMMLRGIVDTYQLSLNTDFIYDDSLKFKKGDALVVFAISPYSKQTVDFIEHCRKNTNISIVLITDLETCPIIKDSDAHLIAGQSQNRYSIIPSIALIESLIIDLGKNKPGSVNQISRLNEIHRENDITTL
ncbi:MurR/RpiR family transcriptional regulator [Texcoconibacillus texcoconensis]|uniref:DNA-binding MurR/RpiR family transcriptional regulator n=1 Tax=Texcoconibacillus texcoconensis TaxID=1095777 RepID=A0A840QKC0_9BACI|nr:MurR/RpiR family transcriptional regulator [Texcoconibacillus texcoconensis]MBB5171896.1 DNA-binding MurR/RpiR family transcriptional regulator [Texcoconibacillus texcoconensis]